MRKLIIGLLAALLSINTALALQTIEAGDEGKTYPATFSRDEITRLAVQDGRIVSMHFPDGRLTVEKDDDQGYAVLRARDDNPVSLVITTSSGQTHSIFLTPSKIGLETILIKEKITKPIKTKSVQTAFEAKAEPLTKSVKRLILAMAREEMEVRDYEVEVINKDIDLWREAQFKVIDKYTGPDITGMRFLLTNISPTVMRLGEQEFYKQGVIAISIDRHVLAPGENTYVYVVMVRQDG